jgi:hypothetical protein
MALEALYLTSTATTKISILLFYRRLSSGTVSNGFLYSVYAAIAFVAVYYFIFMINLFVGCQPIEAFWLQANPSWQGKYECINEAANLIAAAVISVIQDFLACGMPMVLFWKLRIPFRQKIALAAIFGVGFLSVFIISNPSPCFTNLSKACAFAAFFVSSLPFGYTTTHTT